MIERNKNWHLHVLYMYIVNIEELLKCRGHSAWNSHMIGLEFRDPKMKSVFKTTFKNKLIRSS